jgi:predicted transcriptional regulator
MGSDEIAKSAETRYNNRMSDKQVALETIQRMPETASLDEITRRLEFLAAVQKGLDQIERGEVVPHEQVKKELASWFSK